MTTPLEARRELERRRQAREELARRKSGSSIMEPALAIASSMPASIAGGVAGMVGTALEDPQAGEEYWKKTAEDALTYEPPSPEGQAVMQTIGETFGPIAEWAGENIIRPVSNAVGDVVKTASGMMSPANVEDPRAGAVAAALTQGVPAAVLEYAGLKGVGTAARGAAKTAETVKEGVVNTADAARSAAALVDEFRSAKPRTTQQLIEQRMLGGGAPLSPTEATQWAKYEIENGRLVKSPNKKAAMKQGWNEQVVNMVSSASPATRRRMRTQIAKKKKALGDIVWGYDHGPREVVGEALKNRYVHLRAENKKAGAQLKPIVASMKNKYVDVSAATNAFKNELVEMKIKLDGLVPDFEGSVIDSQSLNHVQVAIRDVLTKLKKTNLNDGQELHHFKQYLDENLDFGARPDGALTGRTDNALKKLRHDINASLATRFEKYGEVNTKYKDTLDAKQGIEELAPKVDLTDSARADDALGTALRRTLSNAQSATVYKDIISKADRVSAQYGGKHPDSMVPQMLFSNHLDEMFGSGKQTSFAGQSAQGTIDTIKKGFWAGISKYGAADAAAEGVGMAAQKLMNVNQAAAFKTMEKLLGELEELQ